MSARNVLQSPLIRNASQLKEKMLEKKDKIMEKGLLKRRSSSNAAGGKGREAQLLTKEELPLLMDSVKSLILHLRARVDLEKSILVANNAPAEDIAEKSKVFDTNSESANPMAILGNARSIRTLAETGQKNLLNALNKFSISTIAGVVRLIFQSADVPLLKAEICAEIFSLQDNSNKNRTPIDIDDLRSVLGKAPARNIDILGQLIALLTLDPLGPARLAYSWGPLIFLPRFDHKTSVAKDYESFDLVRQTTMVISVTKLMIEQCMEVFGLDDDDVIRRLGQEIRDQQTADLKNAAIEMLRVSAKPAAQTQPQPQINKPAQPPKMETIIGTCRVAFDFDAEGPLEISVQQGEVLSILEKGDDAWWKVRTHDGREGLVPENYVSEGDDEQAERGEEQYEEEEEVEQKEPEYVAPVPEPKKVIAPAPEPKKVVAPIPEPKKAVAPIPEPKKVVAPAPEPKKVVAPALEPKKISAPVPVLKKPSEVVTSADFDVPSEENQHHNATEQEEPEDIEDEIVALQKKLSELQKLKEVKRRASSMDLDQEQVAPPQVQQVQAQITSPRKIAPPPLPQRTDTPTKPSENSNIPRASFLPSPAALAARKSGLAASPSIPASPALKKVSAAPTNAGATASPARVMSRPAMGGQGDLQAALAARAARLGQQ